MCTSHFAEVDFGFLSLFFGAGKFDLPVHVILDINHMSVKRIYQEKRHYIRNILFSPKNVR
jgi:hypothetical protein